MAQPSAAAVPIADTLRNLEEARKLVLAKADLYPQIVRGVLPLITAGAPLQLRRWGSGFLAEAFAHPQVSEQDKESMAIASLATLAQLFEDPTEDGPVVKAVLQALTCAYPFIFKFTISNPSDNTYWSIMAAIKSKVFRQWDKFSLGIQVCCIKFVQNVILAQTPGAMPDPRRADVNEISLAMVPRNHPVLQTSNLEAEASGLLDRVLDVFHRNEREAIIIDATIYCVNLIVRRRPNTYNKIISAILNYNPLKDAAPGMPMKTRIHMKSMEKTIKAFLLNSNRRNPHHALAIKIQHYVERLIQSHAELVDESKKRAAPNDLHKSEDQFKRAKVGPPAQLVVPPLPPGPITLAQLFKLTTDEAFTSFHVEQLPLDLVIKITLPILSKIDQNLLNDAVNAIRSRCLALGKTQAATSPAGVAGVDDDDDDYEPDFQPSEDNEQILNKLDSSTDRTRTAPDVSLAPFVIPQPAPISPSEAMSLGRSKIVGLFASMNQSESTSLGLRKSKAGFHRLAGGNQRSEHLKTLVLRLISRGTFELQVDREFEGNELNVPNSSLPNFIRHSLFSYIMDDFRSRMMLAFDWLSEEWYCERLRSPGKEAKTEIYEFWALKLLNGIFPFVDSRDKVLLIRFLSEIPEVSQPILSRFKDLAKDPERVTAVVNALYYLVLYRPPNRQMALDALEDLWRNFEGAGPSAAKLLKRYRPELFNEESQQDTGT